MGDAALANDSGPSSHRRRAGDMGGAGYARTGDRARGWGTVGASPAACKEGCETGPMGPGAGALRLGLRGEWVEQRVVHGADGGMGTGLDLLASQLSRGTRSWPRVEVSAAAIRCAVSAHTVSSGEADAA